MPAAIRALLTFSPTMALDAWSPSAICVAKPESSTARTDAESIFKKGPVNFWSTRGPSPTRQQ